MKLLDEENQKWYCHKDDELYYAKENHWGPLPYEGPKFQQGATEGALAGLAIFGPVGAIAGAGLAYSHQQQIKKNAPVAKNLIEGLTQDPQYEDAFKEWWVKTFPKKIFDREAFLSFTTEYVNSGLIRLKNNEVKFSGAAKAVGKLYLLKTSKSASQPTLTSPTQPESEGATTSKNFCIECGKELELGSKFCNKCGTKQP